MGKKTEAACVCEAGQYPAREQSFALLLAHTRALADLAQSFHWRTTGGNYYGDHLLFERIYNETYEQIDGIAEKGIGTTGNDRIVDPIAQVSVIHSMLDRMTSKDVQPQQFPAVLMKAVNAQISMISMSLKVMEHAGELSDGIDNLFQGLADLHEGHVYLLQRRIAG